MLHDLASEPSTAAQALKLLHELQVHQIELDLQVEQTEYERVELDQAYERQVALFAMAPFAYLTLKPNGQVVNANRMAHAWSDVILDASAIRTVDEFFGAESKPLVQEALRRIRHGSADERLLVSSKAGVRLSVRATPSDRDQLVLWAFMPLA